MSGFEVLRRGELTPRACAAFAAACAERAFDVLEEVEEVDVALFEHVLELAWLRALGEAVSLDEARHAVHAATESLDEGRYDLDACERSALAAVLYAHQAAFGEDPALGAERAAHALIDAAQCVGLDDDDASRAEEKAWIARALSRAAQLGDPDIRRESFDVVPPCPARWPIRRVHRFDFEDGVEVDVEAIAAERAETRAQERAARAARVEQLRARSPVRPWRRPNGVPDGFDVQPVGRAPSSTEGKLITPGHEHVGLFHGDQLVFAPPNAVALGMSPDERGLFAWRVDKREGLSGVGRGDYRWILERYAWPAKTLDWQHVVADQEIIDWCWPADLTVPADADGRLISMRARSEDEQAWIHIVEGPDGTTRETRDRDEARALAEARPLR